MTRETITPEMAETYLGRNRRNRHVRPAVVTRYARDMVNRDWLYTGEAIKFDTDGNLIDGQHRLHAVIEADCPVEMEVIRGLDLRTQDLMDTGIKRTYGDMLSLHGYTNTGTLAASVRIALRVETATLFNNKFIPTSAEILEYVEENPGLVESNDIGRKYASRFDMRPSVGCYAHFALSRIDRDAADAFIIGAATKIGLEEGDPRLVLAQRLGDIRRQNIRITDGDALSLMYRAWNHWRDGNKMRFIRTQSADGGHVAIPVPH